jgi:low temperature requirement protein LtrA
MEAATPARAQHVTPLELLFDLVLVFAITQVTGFISANPTWLGVFEGLAILAALWWAWVSYAWLSNSAGSDEGAARVVLLAAMGGLLITSLAVPEAFGADALAFGIAYLGVRLLHLGSYLIVARGNPELHGCSCWPVRSTASRAAPAGRSRWRSTTEDWRCAASRAGASSRRTSPSDTA